MLKRLPDTYYQLYLSRYEGLIFFDCQMLRKRPQGERWRGKFHALYIYASTQVYLKQARKHESGYAALDVSGGRRLGNTGVVRTTVMVKISTARHNAALLSPRYLAISRPPTGQSGLPLKVCQSLVSAKFELHLCLEIVCTKSFTACLGNLYLFH